MEAFQGVFAKRGESEASARHTTGNFEDVFVRRGRWRKNVTENSDVINPADAEVATAELLEDSKNECTSPYLTLQQFSVKNTFLDTAGLDFDSLKDFLKERKVQSCPVSRQGSNVTATLIDEILAGTESELTQQVFNTASSLGDLPFIFTAQKEADHCDDGISMPSGSTGSGEVESIPNEDVLNTSSTFSDSDFDMPSPDTSVVAEAEIELDGQAAAVERLRTLRMRGVEIQHNMGQLGHEETRQAATTGAGVVRNLPTSAPNQWMVAVQTPEGMRPGIITLLGNCQPEQQPQFSAPPPSEPPCVNAGRVVSAVPPPMAAPTIRLADAIAPPELGTPELPSIGSLMHHKGGCKPCTFFHTRGCENKADCTFCHLCGPNEKKKRLKAQKAAQREANFIALEKAKAVLASYRTTEQYLQVETIVE